MMLRKVLFATGVVAGLSLASAEATLAAAGTYDVDKVHSTVLFRVKHMNASFAYGRFNDISGQFAFDDQDPAQSHFEFVVKADSVDTASPQRDQHLKSPDFLSAVQYPTITFKSKSVAKAGPEVYQVTGDLTFHGVTRPIAFKLTRTGSAKDFKGKPIAGFEAPFWIKRSEFNMSPKMIGPVGDDVLLTVSVEGAQ